MILVVDHDPHVLETARVLLNRDRDVFLASSPAKAVEMAQRLDFSVALVDLDLPAVALLIEKLREANPRAVDNRGYRSNSSADRRSQKRIGCGRDFRQTDWPRLETGCRASPRKAF